MMDLAFTSSAPQFDENTANIYQGSVQNTGNTLKSSDIKFPSEGETFGELHIQSVGIDAPLIYGDNIKNMINGVELYSGTYLPGQGRTILIGGHNNTYFLPLPNVNVGDQVELCTNYGTYLYEITGSQTTRYDNTTAYDLTKQEENLILYTCHNIAGIGATPYRVFVYAQYVSGPRILS
jgi:sortase A